MSDEQEMSEEVRSLEQQLDCATEFCRQYQIEVEQLKERIKELESQLEQEQTKEDFETWCWNPSVDSVNFDTSKNDAGEYIDMQTNGAYQAWTYLKAQQPAQEPVFDPNLFDLATLILSDCGISENNQRLYDRVLERLIKATDKPQEPVTQDPEWVVNDLGELGVKVNERFYFLYKGDSLEYKNGKHDDGSDMLYRMVGKREFGETCRPDSFFNNPNARDEKGRYVMSLVFHDGLSFGKPNDANWKPIIPPVKEVTE